METTNVFDIQRPITLKLLTREGIKAVHVRFPNDEEWIERQRRRKVTVKNLGRGISETIVADSEEVDASLIEAVKQDGSAEIDAYEAQKLVEQLSIAEVEDVTREGGSYRVLLRVLGASTTHLLKMPSAKQVADYRRGFLRVFDLPHNRQQITINLRAAMELYKELVEYTEGYIGDAPAIHQAVVVKAAIDTLEEFSQEDRGVNF